MKTTIPVTDVKPGDRLQRFNHLIPVLTVKRGVHPISQREVVEVTHERGTVCFHLDKTVEVERTV